MAVPAVRKLLFRLLILCSSGFQQIDISLVHSGSSCGDLKPFVPSAAQSCSNRLPEDTAEQKSSLDNSVRFFQKIVILCLTIRHV